MQILKHQKYLQYKPLADFSNVFHAVCYKELASLEDVKTEFAFPKIFKAGLVHGTKIEVIDSMSSYPGGVVGETDGLVTNTLGIALTLTTADCVAVLLFDPVKNAIGIVHAGRKGTEDSILEKAVSVLTSSFDSNPADILAFFGPSICEKCYQIDRETDLHYDLWGNNKRALLETGLSDANIFLSGLCTSCNANDRFWSYRKDSGTPNRNFTLIMLK